MYKRQLAGFSVLLDLALQLILGLLLGAMATLAVRYAVPPVQIGGTTLVNLLTLVIYPVSMLLPTLVLKSGARLTFAQACSLRRPQRGYCLPTVALVLGLSTVGVLLDTLISSFFQRFGVVPSTTLNSLGSFSALDIALYVVLLVLLPPLLEEFLFRGALLQLLRPFGDGFAIVLSAVLFALAHGNLVQAPTALLVGLALGFVTVRSGSIWPAVLGHFANNAVAVAGDLALTFVQPPLQSILQLTLHLVWLALGLAALLVLLLRRPDALRLRPPRTRETTAAKAAVVFSRPGMVVFLLVTAAMIVTNFQVL